MAVLTRSDFRVPQHATSDLTGARVLGTVSRGKHLLTRFSPAEGPLVSLHTHLKMEGAWHVHAPGTRWRRPAHEARVVLATDRWEAVGFALGVVELLPTAREDRAVGHLGPDLLGPDWDEEEVLRRLAADPGRTLGEALLDQRNLAGIGTIFRSETLFLSGVSPFLPRAGGAGPRQGGEARAPPPGRQPRASPDHHDRRRSAWAAALGLRPGRTTVSPLRDQDQDDDAGPRALRPGDLLVPVLPARRAVRDLTRARRRRPGPCHARAR